MRAQTADDILDSPVWKDTIKRLTERIETALHNADPEDEKLLRKLAHERRAVASIVLELEREARKRP
jgi:hypothetical protein